jgi:hypothetical protein
MKQFFLSFVFALAAISFAQAQGRANDIPVSQLPAEVKAVLVEYVDILRNSKDLDECAEKFIAVAGGSLVNEDGLSLRSSVQPFSLKKDYNNVKWYANPIKITRVNVSTTNGSGYGESAIKGKVYKIWIDKADKSTGMPAPISIVVPEGHASIKTPKVVNIGSL